MSILTGLNLLLQEVKRTAGYSATL